MEKFIAILMLALCFTGVANAQERVSGYVRSNGTVVQPYMRSEPDNTTLNNYSHVGNVNPYTGQEGTRTDMNSGFSDSNSSFFQQNRSNR